MIGMHVAAIALTLAIASVGALLERISAQEQTTPATKPSSRRVADGKHWTTENLNASLGGYPVAPPRAL